jgi:dTDP-4-dehydrorhamnose 3,5-epimerase
MEVSKTSFEGVLIVEPDVFGDERGFFMETFHRQRYNQEGMGADFVQDNLSFSEKGIIRGLHYQFPNAQAKLVHVIKGEVFDVIVDIRKGSATFGQWISEILSDENKRQIYIPSGFAHGFCVLSDTAFFAYKCSDFYAPESEGGVLWSDPDLAINWPLDNPVLSEKDGQYPCLKDIAQDRLPVYGEFT